MTPLKLNKSQNQTESNDSVQGTGNDEGRWQVCDYNKKRVKERGIEICYINIWNCQKEINQQNKNLKWHDH